MRIMAVDMASSISLRASYPLSWVASSQDFGVCVSLRHNRQLTISQVGLRQRNSRSFSMGGYSAAKLQKGHVSRFSMLAMRRTASHSMRSKAPLSLLSRNLDLSLGENPPLQPSIDMHSSLCLFKPTAVSALRRAQSIQKA